MPKQEMNQKQKKKKKNYTKTKDLGDKCLGAIHKIKLVICITLPRLLPGKSHGQRSLVGCSPWGCEESDTTDRLHFHFHALEKEMATHSSVLAWRIPEMVEPGGLPSMESHRVRHD